MNKNYSTEHSLNLQPLYFDLIKRKEKTLEGRLNDEKRKLFNIGDIITFHKEPERAETFKTIIVDKYIFKTFEEMATKLKKEELGFANQTKEEMLQIYRTFYSMQNEEQYGVVAFRIKLL